MYSSPFSVNNQQHYVTTCLQRRTVQTVAAVLTCESQHTYSNLVSLRSHYYYYNYNRFTTLCPRLLRWVGIRRINHSGFCWCKHDGVAVAPGQPYASHVHFAPEDNHTSTSSVRFLRVGCPSWHPTNSVKALKAIKVLKAINDMSSQVLNKRLRSVDDFSWLWSLQWISFSARTLLVGWQEGQTAQKNTNVLSQNKWRKKT